MLWMIRFVSWIQNYFSWGWHVLNLSNFATIIYKETVYFAYIQLNNTYQILSQVWDSYQISVIFSTFTSINFFEGLYFQENFIWKTSILKNKDNKISQGRENSLRNEVRGWVELCSPDPLKPLPTGWENTERIASLNSNS